MNQQYDITIQAEDLVGAKRGDCRRCLVANAIKRVTGKAPTVGILQERALVDFPGCAYYDVTKGRDVIGLFDRKVDPQTLIGRKLQITFLHQIA